MNAFQFIKNCNDSTDLNVWAQISLLHLHVYSKTHVSIRLCLDKKWVINPRWESFVIERNEKRSIVKRHCSMGRRREGGIPLHTHAKRFTSPAGGAACGKRLRFCCSLSPGPGLARSSGTVSCRHGNLTFAFIDASISLKQVYWCRSASLPPFIGFEDYLFRSFGIISHLRI